MLFDLMINDIFKPEQIIDIYTQNDQYTISECSINNDQV